jgi:ribonuclease J
MENGNVLEINEQAAKLGGKVQSGRVFIDGKSVGDVEGMILRDRRRLAQEGIIIVLLTVEKLSARVISGPDIITRGFFADGETLRKASERLKDLIAEAVSSLDVEVVNDIALLQEIIRRTAKKYLKQEFDQRPMIMPIIMEG